MLLFCFSSACHLLIADACEHFSQQVQINQAYSIAA